MIRLNCFHTVDNLYTAG